MVRVQLWGSLQPAAGGQPVVEVKGSTARELIDNLVVLYPGLKPQVERGLSVAIDGLIYRDSWLTPVDDSSDVVLMPYMTGG